MRALLPLVAILALAACGTEALEDKSRDGQAVAPRAAVPSEPVTQAAAVDLAGEWRVAGIDGKDFNEPYGLALSADASEIWWEPRCAGVGRGYTISGNAIRFGWAASRGPEPQPGPANAPEGCAIGLPERLADVMLALDSAERIERTPSNGVEISGGGHSLLLFSQ